MNQRPIIALDFPNQQKVAAFLKQFPQTEPLFVKVGMELFYQEGPAIVRWLKKLGHSVFLDLKLHDIPNTVEKAMTNLAKLGIDITNVHAAGGIEMRNHQLSHGEKKSRFGKYHGTSFSRR